MTKQHLVDEGERGRVMEGSSETSVNAASKGKTSQCHAYKNCSARNCTYKDKDDHRRT